MEIMEFDGIRFEKDGVSLIQDNKPYRTVPRASIQSVFLRKGSQSNHPVLQAVLGVAVVLGGLASCCIIYNWFINGSKIWDVIFVFTMGVPVGMWIIRDALKQGWHIELVYQSGKNRLAFDRGDDHPGIVKFLCEARERFGYIIQIEKNQV